MIFVFLMPKNCPGLLVMGDDSCLKGRGFKSQRRILDEHLFTFIC